MDILIGSQNGQVQEVKFETFSVNTSNTSAAEINFSVLPMETSSGTGYPPIKLSVQVQDKHLWIVRDGGAIEAFDLKQNILTEVVVFPFPEDCSVIGIFEHFADSVFAVSDNGHLAFWSFENPEVELMQIPGVLCVQAVAKVSNFLAVGGKGNQNNLKVFDLKKKQIIYTAKSTMDVRINQAINVDIQAICFTKLDSAEFVATANSNGQIFLYDFSKKSSVSSLLHHQVLLKKSLITSLIRAHMDDCVIFTDTTGVVEGFDLRAKKSFGRFKSQEGAVDFTLLAGNASILLTASKDRHLRIFNYTTRALLHKLYLKHVPTTFVITCQDWLKAHAQQYEDSEDEEVWEAMTVVEKSASKKSKLQSS